MEGGVVFATMRYLRKMKKKPTPNQTRGYAADFAKFGIQSFPPYTNAEDYVKNFQRCTVLTYELLSTDSKTTFDPTSIRQ